MQRAEKFEVRISLKKLLIGVLFFALGMERVESRLRESAVRQDELEELLEQPRPDEVRALFRSGTNRALEMFRLRHRTTRGRRPARRSKVSS